MTLRRFWFEFEETSGCRLPFGCGVTAEDEDDALGIVAETFCEGVTPVVRSVVADVEVGDLAERLEQVIRPLRLGVPLVRGIWYPNMTGP